MDRRERRKIDAYMKKKEMDAIRSVNHHQIDLHEEALKILFDLVLVLVGIVLGMYISATRTHAATIVQKNHLAATWQTGAPVVEQIPESFPEEIPPVGINEVAVTAMPEAVEVERVGEPREEWEYLGRWKTTGYCKGSCCNGRNAGRTASGAPMVVGRTVAVGRIPFGTELMVDGVRYVVEDRGTPYGHIDILYGDHRTASNHGIQYKEVYIKR